MSVNSYMRICIPKYPRSDTINVSVSKVNMFLFNRKKNVDTILKSKQFAQNAHTSVFLLNVRKKENETQAHKLLSIECCSRIPFCNSVTDIGIMISPSNGMNMCAQEYVYKRSDLVGTLE